MRTIEQKIYSFDELEKSVQSKVIESMRYMWVEDDMWYVSIIEHYTEQLREAEFHDPKISFSGFGSQGDGACFTASAYTGELVQGREDVPCIKIETRGRYSHKYTMSVHTEPEDAELEAKILEEAHKWADDIYESLEKEYFYCTSDEYVTEMIDLNEYEFYADGRIYKN